MKRYILWLALLFAVLTSASLWGASLTTDFTSNVLLGIFSALLSVTIALILVNFFVDQRSRRVAAAPLMRLVSSPIANFHNNFILWGRDRFGTAQFNTLLDTYQGNGRDPVALSPEQRQGMNELIDENRASIIEKLKLVDARMSDLINVLGWSFDAKIISAALTCKQNIAEFMANLDPVDDKQKLIRLEMYLDADAAAGSVLESLHRVLGRKLEVSDRLPSARQ